VLEIKKAKEKAENYLNRTIKQKWSDIVNSEKMKSTSDYYEALNWPLRLESYSYLANRDKSKINNFAIELRELWNEWIEFNKKDPYYLGREEFFWPAKYEQVGDIDPDGNAERFSGNEIESHISMFRSKEILEIGGFDIYFDKARKRIIEILLPKKHIYLWGPDIRIIWQIVRSPFLRFKLSDYLRVIALSIVETAEFRQLVSVNYQKDSVSFHSTLFQAMAVFFLCFGKFSDELFKLAKKAASKLIDKQEMNGSFEDDVLATCLSASSIYSMKVDPSHSVCSNAIEYILKKQNKEGYWDFLIGFDQLYGECTGWNILSTVVVLETIDLITNDKPLPLWAFKEIPIVADERVLERPKNFIEFPSPEGATWEKVKIRFLSNVAVELTAGKIREGRQYTEIGFIDNRNKSYNLLWLVLASFAKYNGEISWNTPNLHIRVNKNLKKHVHRLGKHLMQLFQIKEEKPFEYCKEIKGYRTKFKIELTNEEIYDDILDDFKMKFHLPYQKKFDD